MPWDNMPIGHMLHQTGNRRIAEPTNAETKSPFATVAFLFAKNFPKGHVGQANLDFFLLFSLFLFNRSSRFMFVLGMNRSTPLSKPSTIVPNGQIQLQKIDPNKNVKTKKIETATKSVKIRYDKSIPLWGATPIVNIVCKPPTGQATHPPGIRVH
jgi:hypothetical protein